MTEDNLPIPAVKKKLSVSRVKKGLRRHFLRAVKSFNQRITVDQASPKQVVFVVGCQRSGTSMMLGLLDQSPSVFVYGETDWPVMRNYRLVAQKKVESVIQRSHAKTIAFKPICDSHWTDRLLRTYGNSKAIWIYRDFGDMVNSSLRKWSSQLTIVSRIADEDWEGLDWRVERLGSEDLAIIKHCCREGITRADAAALQWMLRTGLYRQLKLHENEHVHLVKYEDLVVAPHEQVSRIFNFLGVPFREQYVAHINRSSIRKNEPVTLSPRVRGHCDALLSQMDQLYEQQQMRADCS